jgi:hypothetical protein
MTSESPIILIRWQEKNSRGRKGNSEKHITVEKHIEQRGDMREQGLVLRLRVQSSLQRSDFHL